MSVYKNHDNVDRFHHSAIIYSYIVNCSNLLVEGELLQNPSHQNFIILIYFASDTVHTYIHTHTHTYIHTICTKVTELCIQTHNSYLKL